jgi:catechol 2,3-dioxygenase-like lactoylglutathione lyase family enzyme
MGAPGMSARPIRERGEEESMSDSVTFLHMNHLNAVVDGFDESVAHFRDLFGAQLISDMPRPEWHACLITIGTVIFELFAPHDDLLHARFGPHYIGVEYQVPDTTVARRATGIRGMRIIRDLGVAFHTHPADGFGIALEFYDHSFHDEVPPTPFLEPIKPIEYWRDEHPLGCTGLKRYSVAVSDFAAATKFFQDLTNADILYEAPRPAVGARAIGLALGDTVVELLTPLEAGPIERFLARYGDGIRSTVFSVRDLRQAQSYIISRGFTLEPGDAPDTLAMAPEENRGLLFEFSE